METIHKAKISAEYVVIPNALAQDNRLSFEARGALVMLLSMPDDWSVNKSWLIKQTKAGRDKVTSIIKELELCGYMSKRTTHDKLGKITGIEWHVYPHDTVERITRRTVEPSYGETPTTKETSLESKQGTKEYVRPDGLTDLQIKEEMDTAFKAFWDCWKACKKKMGTYNNSTPKDTRIKWDKHFSKAWWNKNTLDEFESEVNAIMGYADSIHNPDIEFCPAKNLGTASFFKNEGWKGE